MGKLKNNFTQPLQNNEIIFYVAHSENLWDHLLLNLLILASKPDEMTLDTVESIYPLKNIIKSPGYTKKL